MVRFIRLIEWSRLTRAALFAFMNNQNSQSPYGALLSYLLNSGQNTAKTTNDILAGTGLQNTYNTQVALGNAASQAQQKVVDNATSGQVNGSYVNAAPMQEVANQGMIKDSSMPVNLLLGVLNQASNLTQNANNNMTGAANNAANNATTQRGQTLEYGGSDPNGLIGGNGSSPIDNVNQVLAQGGKDLLTQAKTPADEYRIAGQILASGGVATFRKQNPSATKFTPDEQRILSNMNNALTMSYQAQNQLKNSNALKDVLQNPVKKFLADQFLKTGQGQLLQGLGLNAQDVQALQNLDALGQTSVAARAKAKLGLGSSAQQNLTYLNQMNGLMNNDVNAIKTRYGYGSTFDMPGFAAKPDISSFNQ